MGLSLTYPVTSYVHHTDTVLQVRDDTPPSPVPGVPEPGPPPLPVLTTPAGPTGAGCGKLGRPHTARSSEVGNVFKLYTPLNVRWDVLSGMSDTSDLINFLTAFFYR